MKTFKLLFFVLFFIPLASFAQPGNLTTPELKSEARSLFEDGNYARALEIYQSLLERYPKDGQFNYYTGICLYKINQDIPGAIEYLDYASAKPQVPSDVYYYLGLAYRKNYQFQEAKDAFNLFNDVASRSEIRDLKPDLEVQNSGNAVNLTMQYNPFEILATSLFSFADTNYVKQVRGKGGQLQQKPEDFLTRDEQPGELTGYFFMPKNIVKGDYVFMAGYTRSKKSGSELFRVKKNGGDNWGDPEELKELNTEYNEILPYFDPVSNDLYFASEGHNSMGGLDVFKSHYDSERDEWSEPVNLGFPVNSPLDDYLAMPGPDLGTILLITNRQGLDSMLTVYKLILQEPKKSLTSADNEELKSIGNLGGIMAIPEIVDLKKAEEAAPVVTERKMETDEKERPGKEEKTLKTAEEANIVQALSLQKKSDSLMLLANDTRNKVRSMPDPNERWSWQRQIIEWEKSAKDYGEQAAEIFAMIEINKAAVDNSIASVSDHPETIEKDREINGITVYRYTENKNTEGLSEASIDEKGNTNETSDKEIFRTEDEPGDVVTLPDNLDPDMNRIIILPKSPYNSSNPFPKDVEIPDGAFYRIQLGVFSQEIDYDTFKGISPITTESVPGKDLTRYYAGKFNSYEKANEALGKIKNSGFSDAFIVSWYNGQKTSINKVKDLEKRDRP
ncbi:MAG: tetratricopeptide repeat protein [Bacteroidales bacterium]